MSSELAVLGADTSNQQSGGGSFFDNTMMFTGSAVLSGLYSIYNTAVDYGNMAGANMERLDVARTLETTDQNWYKYYKDNQQLADVAGFVASSFIPGTLAIKGLKAAQVGHATGAIGRAVQGPLNFALGKRDAYLKKGLEEMAHGGGSTFAYINANKLASISWGFADNALQAAAAETMIAATMNASPILADRSAGEVLGDMAFGMFLGAGFGGALDAIGTQRIFKDAVKQIGGIQRKFDTPVRYDELGMGVGDEAFGFVDSLLTLPKEIQFNEKFINVKALGGKNVLLDIENHLKRTMDKTERAALEDIQLSLQKISSQNSPDIAQEVSSYVLKQIQEGQAAGRTNEQVKQEIGNFLLGLKKVSPLKDDAPFANDDLFYIKHEVDLSKMPNAKVGDLMDAAFNRKPFDKNATAKPYLIEGSMEDLKVTMTAKSFDEAWEAGNDMAVVGGRIRINPKSEIIKQVTDPILIPKRYWNSQTGGVSDEVVATWADMLPTGTKVESSILPEGVLDANKKLVKMGEDLPTDAISATARHAWASRLQLDSFRGSVVHINDISRLERLAKLGRDELSELGVRVQFRDGTKNLASNLDLSLELSNSKLTRLQELLDENVGMDLREISYMLNTPQAWVERAIANGFTKTNEDNLVDGMSHELSRYLRRENFVATWQSPRSLVSLGAVDEAVLQATEAAASSKGAKYLDSFVTGELGFQQRLAKNVQAHLSAFTTVIGPENAARFMDVDPKQAIKMADEIGAGASALGFANASYGETLRLWAQYTGKLTHQLIQTRVNKNVERIQPFITKLQDNRLAGAELGVITTMLRRSGEKFVFARHTDGSERLVIRELTKVDPGTGERFIVGDKMAEWAKNNPGKQADFKIEHAETSDFLKVWQLINGERIDHRRVLMTSRGQTLGWDSSVIYAPPINTQKYPYFAFVKIKEGHIASTSDAGMITARSQEELDKLVRAIDSDKFDTYTKKDTEQFYKVKHEYDSNLALNEPRVDSMLRKEGKLGDHFYEVRTENVLEDYITHSQQADAALVRQAVDTRYAQLITELNALGKQYTDVATSQASGLQKVYDKTAVNPFGDYVKTALDISKKSSFPLISQLNEFVDSVGTTAYRILVANTERAQKGLISWEDAEKIATKYGIGGVYNADNVETAFMTANRPQDRNLIRATVSKVNMFLATAGLRLDVANSLVNTISLPIMLGTELASLKSLAKSNPEILGALSKVFSTSPDGVTQVPSYTKVIAQAIKNVVGPGGRELVESYRRSGDVKNVALQFHEMMDEIAIKPQLGPRKWADAVDAAVEKGAKWTGNNFSEDFTRALSANVMDQLTAPLVAGKLLTSQEAAAYRSVFVNRVNGNYIASQRPILFQGTVGAAVSLFQTYIFNVMQQMGRHIENKDMRAIMTMTGLQGAIYGLNGLPFFEAVNTHLIGNANINDGHRDIYSATTQLAGKELGEWMLYGTASAFPLFGDKSPALYTRGDINPRHVSILPISPLDVPAVQVSSRIVANLADMGKKLMGGADISSSLLEALEHNGVSRPLAGFAQLAQGYSSTSKGTLISASNDFDLVAASSRMIGAKPMDESVMMNTMFRLKAYQAADAKRLQGLGEIVRTKLRGNQMPEEEEMMEFMKKYASAGGNLQNYSAALSRWNRGANMSVVNQMKAFHSTSYAQRLSEIMSGTTLDDYRNMEAQQQQE